LRSFSLTLEPTTVLMGENGCGKSSLLKALEICLGNDVPSGRFTFACGDFHRSSPGAQPQPLRIRLRFREEGDPQPDLWPTLRQAGLAPAGGCLDFTLRVESRWSPQGAISSFAFEAPGFTGDPDQTLTETRRLLPFIRIHGGSPAQPEPDLQEASPEEQARERVRRQLRADLASLVEVDAVSPSTLASVRDAVEEVLRRLEVAALPEAPVDKDARIRAPMSPSGSWEQMAELLRGSGARSLAMLAFAGAFLQARGPDLLDPQARPIVSIENPETSLHPLMLASVWNLIGRLPTQKLVTTNSTELLAAIPLECLRRMVRQNSGRARAYSVPPQGMSLDDLRRVAYHLRVRRGTALFMRFWLLVEGETEFWLLPEIARALGLDLRAEGVECVEFAQSGLAPLARLANHLGIGWHLLADGDRAGQSYAAQAAPLAHPESGRVTVLKARDIEHCLWEHGYASVYLRAAGLPDTRGQRRKANYAIEHAIRQSSKPQLALVLGQAMRTPRSPGVPPALERMLRDAVHWAAHGRFPSHR
jgi:putative ATP-dependent endonuclease of OLD family